MSAITYLTNIERQYTMMQQVSESLVDDRQLQVAGNVIYLNDAVWGSDWKQLQQLYLEIEGDLEERVRGKSDNSINSLEKIT
jgi:hypothetical protein